MKVVIFFVFTVIATVLFFNVNSSDVGTLKVFTSDGCSAFPDGTFKQKELWLTCCIQHDYDYWQGGTYQQRLMSDQALKTCVTNVGEPEIAMLMLAGVSVGGTPYLPTQFRWGYGWSYPRLYRPLSGAEQKQVQALQPLLTEITVE